MTRELDPRHDAKIAVEILDTLTGGRTITEKTYSPCWWAEGNGSCDCNRRLLATDEDDDSSGCKEERFLIVAVDGDMAGYELWEFNEGYPLDLVEKHLGPEHRRAMEAEDERVRLAVERATAADRLRKIGLWVPD